MRLPRAYLHFLPLVSAKLTRDNHNNAYDAEANLTNSYLFFSLARGLRSLQHSAEIRALSR